MFVKFHFDLQLQGVFIMVIPGAGVRRGGSGEKSETLVINSIQDFLCQ